MAHSPKLALFVDSKIFILRFTYSELVRVCIAIMLKGCTCN